MLSQGGGMQVGFSCQANGLSFHVIFCLIIYWDSTPDTVPHGETQDTYLQNTWSLH